MKAACARGLTGISLQTCNLLLLGTVIWDLCSGCISCRSRALPKAVVHEGQPALPCKDANDVFMQFCATLNCVFEQLSGPLRQSRCTSCRSRAVPEGVEAAAFATGSTCISLQRCKQWLQWLLSHHFTSLLVSACELLHIMQVGSGA